MSTAFINIATKAAYAAASVIQMRQRLPNQSLGIEKKSGLNNWVTEFDKKAEAAIISVIKKAFPEHNIIGEESGTENNNSPFTWIIDPIDGTTNFIHGNPQYSISIALKEKNQIVVAVIFDPNRNDLYKAILGKGAYLNDTRIRVSTTYKLQDALIATGFPNYDPSYIDRYINIFKDILKNTSDSRSCGSAALELAFVASGKTDGFWEFNLQPWDIAAGVLLVKEAGGFVSDFNNTQDFWQNGNIIAANHKIASALLKIIGPHL